MISQGCLKHESRVPSTALDTFMPNWPAASGTMTAMTGNMEMTVVVAPPQIR